MATTSVRVSMVCVAVLVMARVLTAQATTVSVVGETLRVRAPAFGFIDGQVLDQLRDGRSVRVEIDLRVFARAGGPTVAEARETFVLSFDLWEERFAVTRAGTPARSISHLTARAAEAWCLDQLVVPLAGIGRLGRLGRDAPLWIRLEYRVQNPSSVAMPNDDGITIRRIIDALSRKRPDAEPRRAIEAGPLRITG